MTSKSVTNLPASIHQRLLNKARALGRPFNELLQYFVIERFLYCLSCSEHADRFILKGGLMFAIWQEPFVRPTRDIDLLGYGEPAIQILQGIVEKICTVETTQDGLTMECTWAVAHTLMICRSMDERYHTHLQRRHFAK